MSARPSARPSATPRAPVSTPHVARDEEEEDVHAAPAPVAAAGGAIVVASAEAPEPEATPERKLLKDLLTELNNGKRLRGPGPSRKRKAPLPSAPPPPADVPPAVAVPQFKRTADGKIILDQSTLVQPGVRDLDEGASLEEVEGGNVCACLPVCLCIVFASARVCLCECTYVCQREPARLGVRVCVSAFLMPVYVHIAHQILVLT